MTKVDREALKRAMDIAMRDRNMRERLKHKPWEEAAFCAARYCQREVLRLRPWERPPMSVENSDRSLDRGARILLKKMLAAGLSKYEPDPMTALEKLRA